MKKIKLKGLLTRAKCLIPTFRYIFHGETSFHKGEKKCPYCEKMTYSGENYCIWCAHRLPTNF